MRRDLDFEDLLLRTIGVIVALFLACGLVGFAWWIVVQIASTL